MPDSPPQSSNNPEYYDPKARWRTIYPISLVAITSTLNSSVINVSLPAISEQLHAGIGVVDWVIQAFLLVVTALLMVFGRLGDMLGRRRVYQSGIILFTIASALCGFADSITSLIIARIIQGIGAALVIAVGPALIGIIFPPDSRGKAMGILGTTMAVGLSIGPVVGGAITDWFGWRYIFFINIPFGIAAAFMVMHYIKPDKDTVRSSFDLPGAATMALALTCMLLLFSRGNDWGWDSIPILALMGGSLIFPIMFILFENRSNNPLLDLGLFKNSTFSSATYAGFLAFTAMFSQTFLMPFYLIQIRSITIAEAGLILASVPLVMAVIAPASGALSDKIGTRGLCVFGLFTLGMSFVMLTFLGEETSRIYVVLSLLLTGFGIGMFNPPNNADFLSSVPRDRLGNASAMMGLTRTMGMAFGVAVSSVIFTGVRNHLLTREGVSEELPQAAFAFLGALHWVFWVAAGFSWLGMVMVLRRR